MADTSIVSVHSTDSKLADEDEVLSSSVSKYGAATTSLLTLGELVCAVISTPGSASVQ